LPGCVRSGGPGTRLDQTVAGRGCLWPPGVFDLDVMALQPQWPGPEGLPGGVGSYSPEGRADGRLRGPTVDLSAGQAEPVIVLSQPAPPAPPEAYVAPPPRAEVPFVSPRPRSGAVSSLQARSLGELVGGAVAVGFVFVFAASVVSAFGQVPGEGARARLLAAFGYSSFLMSALLLVAMVCLLLLGRSAARGGLAGPSKGHPLKDAVRAALAAESALVGLGALVSFIVYITLAGSLPAAGVAPMLNELGALPVVFVALLWGWAGGTAKLKRLFGVGDPSGFPPDRRTAPD